jgi:hypothetical protein
VRCRGGQPKGLAGRLVEKVKEAGKARATNYTRARRLPFTGGSLPAIGDILYYQRRDTTILRELADDLVKCQRPIVALGHSLAVSC